MFKIAVTPTYTHPVRFSLPGSATSVSFEAVFHRLSQSDLDEIGEQVAKGNLNDRQILDRVLAGWKGIVDEAGEPIEFGSPGTAVVLDTYPVTPATVKAFFESLKDAKAKN